METTTTIERMLMGNTISVPAFQRSYSWDTEKDNTKSPKQTNMFLIDLEEYASGTSNSPFYFGHFLFENKGDSTFHVIDGQQRITTIIIFLSALFKRLGSLRELTESESIAKENMIVRKSIYTFATVDYDDQIFRDYVINETRKDKIGLETVSAKRIAFAYDFFKEKLSVKTLTDLEKLLKVVREANCTTHSVKDESEAIQMFIFQNNRGKRPSNLEILKAKFMHKVHLTANDKIGSKINELKSRFEQIYKSISSIEDNINEDDILIYTLRVYFNSLWEEDPTERIDKSLKNENPLNFITEFSQHLATNFEYLKAFYGSDQKEPEIHSIITLGGIGIAIPFILKAYRYSLDKSELCDLCKSLQSVILRHRVIGTRADLRSRLNDVFQKFSSGAKSIVPIEERINSLKTYESSDDNVFWTYWNRDEFKRHLQGQLDSTTAKFILWKYENHLENNGHSGYEPTRYDKIEKPELEHIAPLTPKDGAVATGYDQYDEVFKNEYIDCLGNYLLISKSHNCSIGNKPFAEKRETYTYLSQQLEIRSLTKDDLLWNRQKIAKRKEKIIEFLLGNF
jgi:uncharacterized protein with ParB-like and HNH nuclease domain